MGFFSNKISIKKIVKLMPGKKHALCETSVGLVKKELKNIPPAIISKFYKLNGSQPTAGN